MFWHLLSPELIIKFVGFILRNYLQSSHRENKVNLHNENINLTFNFKLNNAILLSA